MDKVIGVIGKITFFVAASGMDSDGNLAPLIIAMAVGLLMVAVSDYMSKKRRRK